DNIIDNTLAGAGSLFVDPCFAAPGYWSNVNDPNALWVPGDYPLKSSAGRWDSVHKIWINDDVTSLCIDAGDPNTPVAMEPAPNGNIINMGAYGGMAEASKSPSGLDSNYGGGMGEPNDPYLIYTAEHLNEMASEPNDWGKHFKLMADIDLSSFSYDAALIAPDVDPCDLAYQGTSFTGIFDGNRHAILNLTINGDSYLGLFGRTEYQTEIKNLGVVDVNIVGFGHYIGTLVGFNRGSIATSYSTGVVSGDKRIGGLTGRNWGSITMSYSNVTVNGNDNVGGLTANNYGSITASYSTGMVTANWNVGGLVGENYGNITASYSIGAVSGDQRMGGFIGRDGGDANITTSFWDIETSGQASSAGGKGLTTAQMQNASTYLDADWDFIDETENGTDDIWWINDGQDYPRLWWELIPEN
ncbi:hypothetical protein ACFL3F_05215, partial [Planctomycetota bacterium]